MRVQVPPPVPMETGVIRQHGRFWPCWSRFEPWVSSQASVAHLAERPFRKGKAGGSRPSRGSHALVAEWQTRTVEGRVLREGRPGSSPGWRTVPA
jgi:hypothetical protein